jgi:pimeloyl-ACP methyl ester carboxylesterase
MRQSIEDGMSVRRYGQGPKSIVYLHGLGEAGEAFAPLLADPLIADAFTHVVPDLPGYGRSAWPAEPQSLDQLAHSLTAWLRGVAEPVVLVGHSMGGVLAVLIAEEEPAVVKAIVNIEGNVSIGDCTFSSKLASQTRDVYVNGGREKVYAEIYAEGQLSAARALYNATMRFADPATSHRHACDLVALSKAEIMAPRMAALNVPCTFVADVPNGLAPRSLDLLEEAGVRCVRIEPAGHWVYADQPVACARVINGVASAT